MTTQSPPQSPPSTVSLEQSRAYCEQVTKAYARNFYYGLRLLPPEKRAAMYALYAWMRLVDDIADHEDGRSLDHRTQELELWRAQTHAALHGDTPAAASRFTPPTLRDSANLWPAFCQMAATYRVPPRVFDEVIAGQEQDLAPLSFATFDELAAYCHRVAGVVGLASIYVWGFEGGPATEELALQRGIAFQLTNILRDLKEDAARGRFYLPRSEVNGAMNLADLREGRPSPGFEAAMRFQLERAEKYYQLSAPLESRISPDSRPTLVAMTQIYHTLLQKIAARPARVLRHRVSLSVWAKLRIGWRALRARS
ncbi:MAG: crtB 1 [Phycisphaerales bacterium]|nr:crtB 1 [Phycisphaerales bacterium]